MHRNTKYEKLIINQLKDIPEDKLPLYYQLSYLFIADTAKYAVPKKKHSYRGVLKGYLSSAEDFARNKRLEMSLDK